MDNLQRTLTESYQAMVQAEADKMREGVPGNQWGGRADENPHHDTSAFGNMDDEGPSPKQKEESDIESAEQIFGNQQGLNADWSVPAFHLSGNFPYGMWLVDSMDINGEWEIIDRQEKPASIGYTSSGEYEDAVVTSGEFDEMIGKAQELFQQ